jgi:hypothetical protein
MSAEAQSQPASSGAPGCEPAEEAGPGGAPPALPGRAEPSDDADFSQDMALRATFCIWLSDEAAGALQTVCSQMVDLSREAQVAVAALGDRHPIAEVAAGAQDLHYLAEWFASIAGDLRAVDGDHRLPMVLVIRAKEWARRIEELALEIELALEQGEDA